MKIRYLWQKRKSVVFTWIVSYSVVLFVPWIISLIIYTQSSDALRSEIHRANDSLLKQARYTIDTQIDLMKRLNMEMTWNAKLQSLMYSTKTQGDAQYTAYQLVKDLQTYQTSYASIDEFYVTWEQEGAILRSGNVRELETAFNTIHATGEISYGQWLETIRNSASSRFLLLPHMDALYPKTSIAYLTHLPKDLNGRVTGTVVVMTDLSRFQEAIESISGFSGGQVLILNQDNEVLLSNLTDAHVQEQAVRQLAGGYSAENADFELLSIPSSVSDLKYALVIPSGIFWQKAEYVRKFTYASIAISLLGAGVLTWFFVRRNYSPIQELVRSLSDKSVHGERTDGNELNFIQRAISQTRNEKERIALQLQLHQHTLRSNMLNRLLKGRMDSLVPYDEAFRSFGMKLSSERFATILFVVENAGNLSSVLPGIDADERRKLAQFIITNVVEELVGRHGHAGYVAEIDDMIVCLVNFSEGDPTEFRDELREIATEAQLFLLQFRLDLTISVGGIHEGFAGIAEAYREAVDAMEYKMVRGKREIITYDDIRIDPADNLQFGYYYPLQLEQQIINWIKAGDGEEASRAMDEIMQRNFNKPVVTLTLAKCLIFNLVGTMVKAINEIGDGESSILGDNPLWMDKIIACDTIHEMRKELLDLLDEVCAFAAAKREKGVSQERAESLRHLAAKVIRHIEEHYDDVNLSVNSLGERFELKGSYLSKLFRNEIGEGLPDYINKLRIDRAKRMIRDRGTSISDVAKRVGYNEAATFIRVFKKYEGITPGKFKEMS
ncbi:AraC family transcriptional regulator [Cohnella sp. CIP 111063]|uniref:helix-turn-helix domain-containing protein n=1 Tax=unclassified Cohnella TaxID=2636738 RepID=UPI000B8C3550|nr:MULTISPECIES: helix-turn-helix domain-containing protein [unclassified Cohnella]OXS60245.1 AraC family transcriptional regulator [Cohnella sp. CIP 111063]PRX72924.1 helix-turn-helix protein [Cohnella sp. SGD-V74]